MRLDLRVGTAALARCGLRLRREGGERRGVLALGRLRVRVRGLLLLGEELRRAANLLVLVLDLPDDVDQLRRHLVPDADGRRVGRLRSGAGRLRLPQDLIQLGQPPCGFRARGVSRRAPDVLDRLVVRVGLGARSFESAGARLVLAERVQQFPVRSRKLRWLFH